MEVYYTGVRDDVTGSGVNIEKKLGDTSLEGMLKAGNLAVHLLPYSSIKGKRIGNCLLSSKPNKCCNIVAIL